MNRTFLLWSALAAVAPGLVRAEQVAVLELPGDVRDQVRGQILEALAEAGAVQVVPSHKYRDYAEHKGFRGPRLASDAAIRVVAPKLKLDAVVAGEVGERFTIRIFDAKGELVWTKDLPLTHRRLSAENAKRLAAAIAVAAHPPEPAQAGAEPVAPALPPPGAGVPEAVASAPDAGTPTAAPEAAVAPTATPGGNPAPGPAAASAIPIAGPSASPALPPVPPAHPTASASWRLPLLAAYLTGSTNWRGYCARPGVNSCAQWDALPEGTQPAGETVNFTALIPYAGYMLHAEAFPAGSASAWWAGFGVVGGFAQAFSLTTVTIRTPSGSTPDRSVASVDLGWAADAAYRYPFELGGDRLPAYAGLRAGIRGHDFNVDPDTGILLGGSHRRFAAFGLEGGIALARMAKVDLAGFFFLNPRPGEEELSKYGTSVKSLGFGAEASLTGEVWGPLGYAVRFSLEGYGDVFSGAGTRWASGGATQEIYGTLYWGVTARY